MQGRLGGFNVTIPDPPVVDGWEAVEFRIPNNRDWFCDAKAGLCEAICDFTFPRWIMRRKPRRRIVFEECASEEISSKTERCYYLTSDGVVNSGENDFGAGGVFVCWLRRTDEEVGE